MLDEISEKFGFLATFFNIWRRPFSFIDRLSLSEKSVRKDLWKFAFFGIGTAVAVSALLATVVGTSHFDDACPMFKEILDKGTGRRLSIIAVGGILVTGVLVHVIYLISGKAREKALAGYLSAVALGIGFLALNLTAAIVPSGFALDRIATQFGSKPFTRCGATLTTVELNGINVQFEKGGGVVSMTPDIGNVTKDDPLALIEDSPEFTILTVAGIIALVAQGTSFLMLVNWTSKYYGSSMKMALLAICLAGLPMGLVDDNAGAVFGVISAKLDTALPKTFRSSVKGALGI